MYLLSKKITSCLFILSVLAGSCSKITQENNTPALNMYTENSNYFMYNGQPVILLSTTEHYKAINNRKIDYKTYLNTLHAYGFNVASIKSGVFLEPTGDPKWEDLLIPWARSQEPGYLFGGNKFDLSKWDEDYFERLDDFVAFALERDIFVKYIFFTPFFFEYKWDATPFNPANNINTQYAGAERVNAYTLDKHEGLLDVQKELVDKVVALLAKYPNVIYEVVFDGGREWTNYDWYRHMWDYLHTQMGTNKKPVFFNVGIVREPLQEIFENATAISYIFTPDENLHYLQGHGLPIFMSENSFFPGWEPFPRRHAYRSVLSGTGGYTHVDFTFNSRYPDGNNIPYPRFLFGGGPQTRSGMASLAKIMNSCDFVKMRPNPSLVKPQNILFEVALLENPGNEYLAYISKKPGKLDYRVAYQGYIVPIEEGYHTITANATGTLFFSLNNRTIANENNHGQYTVSEKVYYNGKDPIPFELEAILTTHRCEARLFMDENYQYEEVISIDKLLTTNKKTPGVEATYFVGSNYNQKRLWRIEEKVHHKTVNPSPFVEENQIRKTSFYLNLPPGKYHCQWIDPVTAAIINEYTMEHTGGEKIFRTPHFIFDVLLKINKETK